MLVNPPSGADDSISVCQGCDRPGFLSINSAPQRMTFDPRQEVTRESKVGRVPRSYKKRSLTALSFEYPVEERVAWRA